MSDPRIGARTARVIEQKPALRDPVGPVPAMEASDDVARVLDAAVAGEFRGRAGRRSLDREGALGEWRRPRPHAPPVLARSVPGEVAPSCQDLGGLRRPGLEGLGAVVHLVGGGEFCLGRACGAEDGGPAQSGATFSVREENLWHSDRDGRDRRQGAFRFSGLERDATGRCFASIPALDATPENAARFGARLLGARETASIRDACYSVNCFRYGPEYFRDHVLQPAGGGGTFLETHDFPHLEVPLSDEPGYMLLGRRSDEGLEVAALRLRRGQSLLIESNTLHSNDYQLGPWLTGLARPSKESHFFLTIEGGLPGDPADAVVFVPDRGHAGLELVRASR